MKLSEAIKIGSAQSMPGFERLIYYDVYRADITYACALGAAAIALLGGVEAASIAEEESLNSVLLEEFPILCKYYTCPEHECMLFPREIQLRFLVIHLNDYHEWSREDIADWVEKVIDGSYHLSRC